MTRALDAGSLLRLDAQDAMALALTLEAAYPVDVLETMTAGELRTAGALLGLAAHRLEVLDRRTRATRRRILERSAP